MNFLFEFDLALLQHFAWHTYLIDLKPKESRSVRPGYEHMLRQARDCCLLCIPPTGTGHVFVHVSAMCAQPAPNCVGAKCIEYPFTERINCPNGTANVNDGVASVCG